MEKIRIWRIVLGIIAALALFVAVLLTLAAATTPEWQVAELQQVNQIHYIGLYQKCVFALRQGPSSFPQWLCTYMPYEQNPINYHNNLIPGTSEVDYNGYGGIECKMIIFLVSSAINFELTQKLARSKSQDHL